LTAPARGGTDDPRSGRKNACGAVEQKNEKQQRVREKRLRLLPRLENEEPAALALAATPRAMPLACNDGLRPLQIEGPAHDPAASFVKARCRKLAKAERWRRSFTAPSWHGRRMKGAKSCRRKLSDRSSPILASSARNAAAAFDGAGWRCEADGCYSGLF
jgi:hypothetical protein